MKNTTRTQITSTEQAVVKASRAAVQQGRSLFVVPTYYGLRISVNPTSDKFIECTPDGITTMVETVWS